MGIYRSIGFVFLFSLPIFLAFYSSPSVQFLRENFFSWTQPAFYAGETFRDSVRDTFSSVKRIIFLYRENEKLERELELLEREVVDLREARKENELLRSLLDFKKLAATRSVSCRVIAREVGEVASWALLDKGAQDKIRQEMPVVSEKGLIGKVIEAGPDSARVLLLTDRDSRVSGVVQSSRDTGLVVGDGSPLLKMKFLTLDSDIPVGDWVVTAGLGDVYPKGIPIGRIEAVKRGKNGLHLYATIQPVVSFSKLEAVLCLDYRPEGS